MICARCSVAWLITWVTITVRGTAVMTPSQSTCTLSLGCTLGTHSIKVTVDVCGHLVPGANKAVVDRLDQTTVLPEDWRERLAAPEERVEALYLAALGRAPKAEELKRSVEYVKTAGTGEAKARYADVLWALLNGVEFRTNH